MNTAAKVGLAVGIPALAFGIYKGVTLFKKSEAGGKLEFELDDVGIDEVLKSGPIPSGIKYKIRFSIKNPSDQQLGFENLFVKISLKNEKGEYSKIADTAPSEKVIEIPVQKTTTESVIAEVRFLNVIGELPDVATYLMNRARGKKATRDAKIEWTYKSEGINLSDSKTIKL